MTTTIGSLDLNSANSLYNDATQYFWFESDSTVTYGAGVHITLSPSATFISNPTGQNILMNTDGISIRNGLLPMMTLDNDSLDFNMIDTISSTITNIATFGLQTRIGRDETGYSRILIDPSSDNVDLINAFEVLTPDNISAFSQKIDKTREVSNKNFINYLDNVYTLGVQYINFYSGATNTKTETFVITDLNNVTSGTNVNVVLSSRLAVESFSDIYTYLKFDINFDIVKGTSSTFNTTNIRGDSTVAQGIIHAISVSYNGDNQMTITSSITKVSTSQFLDYRLTNTYISQISYIKSTVCMPVVFQNGDAVLCNKGVGRVMLELNENDALFEDVTALGWNVFAGVTISPNSTYISNVGTTTVALTAITVPPHLEVTWTSLSTYLRVTDSGIVSYVGDGVYDDDPYEIQATVSFAGKTYTDTCFVNVDYLE